MALKDDETRKSDAPPAKPEEPEAAPAKPEAESAKPEAEASAEPAAPAETAVGGAQPAPLWVVPLYVAGFLLVYLGERVLEPMPTGHWVATWAGLVSVVAATIVRFMPKYRVGGERRDIERLLGVLSALGVVGLGAYALTTDFGWEKTGLIKLGLETQDHVRGVLTILWVALVAISLVPMIFAEAALLPMRHAERPESRRVRAAAVSGLALVLAAIYGALFVYSAGKLDVKADYSYFKTSRPSESTRKVAESLDQPVEVVAFFPQVNVIKSEVERYLTDLGRGIPNLKIEVVDRLLVPKRAKELKATQDGVIVLAKGQVNESLSIGVDEKNALPKLKTLDRDFQEKLLKLVRPGRVAYLTVGHGELNDPSQKEDGERAVRIARTLLQKQNYLVKDLGLAQGLGSDVPDDADVVLVLGPTEPFTREELASLQRFGDRGGRLFIALDPDAIQWGESLGEGESPTAAEDAEKPEPHPSATPAASAKPAPSAKPAASAKPAPLAKPAASAKLAASSGADAGVPPGKKMPEPAAEKKPVAEKKPEPAAAPAPNGLDALARVVGLDFSPVELANEKQHMRRRYNDSDRTLLYTNRFSSHAAVSTLSRNSGRAAVLFFGSGSLERAPGANEKVDFSVHSMPGTFADANKNYRPDGDEKPSTFNLAAAVTRPRTAEPLKKKPEPEPKDDKKGAKKDNPDEMRAFVMADADALTDVVLAQVPGNQLLFADAVRWLGGEESFSGEVNTEEDVRIEHTKQKDLAWFYATIFGAPALILGVGIALSRRSRRGGER